MSVWVLIWERRDEFLTLCLEHLFLVGVATLIATAIGVPLGIVLTRRPALSKAVLGFANVMQTVPSLALFGFLIPLNVFLFDVRILGGIGARTAIVAIVLYALLPIVRNTFTGISGVDPAIREAGRGMGMTDWQLLWRVEMPLAAGVILAGVRVATVISVGTATIAAAIDAGGLGRYIFRGLRMNDNALIFAGALPAAMMALSADFLLGWMEKLVKEGAALGRRRLLPWGAALAGGILAGGLFLAVFPSGSNSTIAVGSKDFTEQIIVGELLAQLIEEKMKIPVKRRFDLGGNLAHEALLAGEIAVYVEYTGTALTALLRLPPMSDSTSVYRRVREEYKRLDLAVMEPLGFNNTFAVLVREEDARRFGLKRISDLSGHARGWRAGFGQDFMSRPDGYSGFAKRYGLGFAEIREMDLSLTYRALAEKEVDLIAGNSTDGLITRYGLFQLEDDRSYFPPYDAVPIARRDVLDRHPGLAPALRALKGLISVAEMRRLNFQVDGERRAVKEVARDFLREKGLVAEDAAGR
jgi:osmoprotectant transport system permease protein